MKRACSVHEHSVHHAIAIGRGRQPGGAIESLLDIGPEREVALHGCADAVHRHVRPLEAAGHIPQLLNQQRFSLGTNVTARFGSVTAEFGSVTGRLGDVTDEVSAPA